MFAAALEFPARSSFGGRRDARLYAVLAYVAQSRRDEGRVGSRGMRFHAIGGFPGFGTPCRRAKEFIQPARMDFAAEEFRLSEDAPEEADIGFDAGDGILLKGAAETRDLLVMTYDVAGFHDHVAA